MRFSSIFDRSSITCILDFIENSQWNRRCAAFSLDRSWDRFWIDFGSIFNPKLGPKSLPRKPRRVLKIIVVFDCLLEPSKINFSSSMDRFCPPKMAPSWVQNGVNIGPKLVLEAKSALEPILNRFLVDLWSKKSIPEPIFLISARFLIDLGTILDGCLVDFWFVFDWLLLHFSDRSAAPGR